MPNLQPSGEVLLAEQRSASTVLQAVLADGIAAFPEALAAVSLPEDPKAFRKAYPELLPDYEAARLASPERNAIARHLVTALKQHVVWQDGAGSRPLSQ